MSYTKRLIDANEAYEIARTSGFHNDFARSMADLTSLEEVLEDCTTVEAVEVVHAQWDNNGICTLCGYPIPTYSKYDFIYGDECLFCYHCGAKMDGGNEDV